MSAICARPSRERGDSQEGGNRRCLPSCPSPWVRRIPALRRAQLPAMVQRKTPRPSGANPPAAVRVPRSAGAEKKPPVRGEHAYAVRVPRSAGAEKTACAVRVPRSPYAEKTKKAPLTRCLSLLRICWPLSSSSCRNYRSRRRYYHHRYRRNRSRRCPDRSIPRSG